MNRQETSMLEKIKKNIKQYKERKESTCNNSVESCACRSCQHIRYDNFKKHKDDSEYNYVL